MIETIEQETKLRESMYEEKEKSKAPSEHSVEIEDYAPLPKLPKFKEFDEVNDT